MSDYVMGYLLISLIVYTSFLLCYSIIVEPGEELTPLGEMLLFLASPLIYVGTFILGMVSERTFDFLSRVNLRKYLVRDVKCFNYENTSQNFMGHLKTRISNGIN